MDRLLSRLERRLGWLAIPNLATFVAGLSAFVFAIDMIKHGFIAHLALAPSLVAQGQVWRLVTFMFIPPGTNNPIFVVVALLFYWSIAAALEATWGSFKFNVFYLLGMLGTIAAALLTGAPMTSWYLHLSLVLAFGTVFPDHLFYLYFLLPVKAKWMAVFDAAILLYVAVVGSLVERLAIGAAIGNYLIFFGPHLIRLARGAAVVGRQRGRQPQFASSRDAWSRPNRKCSVCGVSDEDGADLRVCNCQEYCGGKATVYCLPHARTHNKPSDQGTLSAGQQP